MTPGTWEQYQKLIMAELERLSNAFELLDQKFDNLAIELATLKARSRMWGAIAGMIAGGALVLLQQLL
jgi:hypothetical protein